MRRLFLDKYYAYLDESGDLGWKFDAPYMNGGSSRYFTISTIIVHEKDKHRLERAVKKFREKLEKKHKVKYPVNHEIKASDLKLGERFVFAEILKKELDKTVKFSKVFSITVKKENVEKQSFRTNSNILYNYMTGLSFLKDIKDLDQLVLIADKRITSVNAQYGFNEYLQTTLAGNLDSKTTLNIIHQDSKDSRHVQCADLVANLIWRKYEFSKLDPYSVLGNLIKDRTLFF